MRMQTSRWLSAMTVAKKPPRNPLIVVLGATGTGKSQLAVELAKRFNGEVINGDAVQMYRGLPIVTNQITVAEQEGIPHHLLGFIGLEEETWQVGLFKTKAAQIIREIHSRGRLPILVGGTHYYTQSLLFEDSIIQAQVSEDGDSQTPSLTQEIAERFPILDGPTEDIIARLRQVDPVMADRWHPNDRRKIQRSLEIYLTTGKKASDIYMEQKQNKASNGSDKEEEQGLKTGALSPLLFWVHADKEVLKKRLDGRVEKMVDAGLVEEVKAMDTFIQEKASAGTPVDQTRGIWVSIGFKEFEPYIRALTSGIESLSKAFDLAVEQTQAATRQYAKRQIRWIRLKLIQALKGNGMLDRLYLLDGTDVANWTVTVSNPSIEIAKSFLEGAALPPPREVCMAAKELLDPESELNEKPDIWFRQECELCGVVSVTDLQWQTHLKSRRHRGVVKKQFKNEERGKYLRNTVNKDPGEDST